MRRFSIMFLVAIIIPLPVYAGSAGGNQTQFPPHPAGLEIEQFPDCIFLTKNCGCMRKRIMSWPREQNTTITIMVNEDYCTSPSGFIPRKAGPYCAQLKGNYTYLHDGHTGKILADEATAKKMQAVQKIVTGAQ